MRLVLSEYGSVLLRYTIQNLDVNWNEVKEVDFNGVFTDFSGMHEIMKHSAGATFTGMDEWQQSMYLDLKTLDQKE